MDAITAQIRHYITYLAGIGGLLLSWHLIAPADVAKANEAGVALIEPLTVIAGLIVAGITRLAISWVTNTFTKGKDSGGPSGGVGLLLSGLLVGTAAAVTLSSCSSAQLASAEALAMQIPIKACYTAPDGTAVCYSSRDGVEVDVASGK